jgi:hypothetical protein
MEGTAQTVTAFPNFVDFLAQPQPFSNLERQWIHQHNKKCAKKYHHCRWCGKLLLRLNGGVEVFSPTNQVWKAFCRNNGGACKNGYMKADLVVRVRTFSGVVPQPMELSLLKTSEHWDKLRAECDTAGTRPTLASTTVIDPSDVTLARIIGPAWPGHKVRHPKQK